MPGVAGPKFARITNSKKAAKVRAVVVEYDSNSILSTSYTEMDTFFEKVCVYQILFFLACISLIGLNHKRGVTQKPCFDGTRTIPYNPNFSGL